MPGSVVFYLVLLGLAVVGGATQAYFRSRGHEAATVTEDRSGWLYFITAQKREDAPVKIGMSSKDPTSQRLTELRTMSPFPLKIIYKTRVRDRFLAEAIAHDELARYRKHGEWFDRDAALMYIAHLKGEV